jgi:hypothetical protein
MNMSKLVSIELINTNLLQTDRHFPFQLLSFFQFTPLFSLNLYYLTF